MQHQQRPHVTGVWPRGAVSPAANVAIISQAAPSQEAPFLQHIVRLKQENASLRDYAERVTKELRSARLSLAITAAANAAGGFAAAATSVPNASELQQQAEKLPLPPWCLNMHLVSPLLAAYDERIAELQAAAREKDIIIEQFNERVAGVTRENEQLAEELRSTTSRLQKLFEAEAGGISNDGVHGAPRGGMTYNSLLQERNELEELYSLTAEQSEVLLSQNHLLKCHVEQSEAALEEMRAVMGETERRAADVAAREDKMARQEEAVERQAMQLKNAKEQNEKLAKKLAELKAEMEKLSAALKDATTNQEIQQKELQQQRAAAASAAQLQRENEVLVMQVETAVKEKSAAKEVADYLEKRLATQMHETEEIRKQIDTTTQQLHVALVEKEKASAAAALLQQHLDQLREKHETELQLLKAAQGDTLEKRAVQAENLAERLRQQLEALHRSNGEASVKLEAAERRAAAAAADAKKAREELSAAISHHQTLQQHLQESRSAAELELARVKEALSTQIKEVTASASALASSKRQLEGSLEEADAARIKLQQQKQDLEKKCEQLQETASIQRQQLEDAEARIAAAEAAGEAAQRKAEREAADARRRCESLTALAEAKARRIQEAAELRKKENAKQLLEEQQQRQRIVEEFSAKERCLKQQLSNAAAANAQLRSKVNELLNGLDQALPSEEDFDEFP